jgi:hypothetical protein
MQVRMAGGWPVGVAGLRSHPVSQGALCPLGFGAHQLNWHPLRLRRVRRRGNGSCWDEARSAFVKACGEGAIAIVDGYPGRAASSVFEAFAQSRSGVYRVVLPAEIRALTPFAAWSDVPATALGYDLENAQTILSFGAPLLDGWGTPGRFTRLWAERAAGQTDPHLRLIQVEASLSPTAARSWQWVAIRPGSESALAAGIARVLLEERLVAGRGPMPPLSVAESAAQSGISADAIRGLARLIAAHSPAVAIANDADPAIAALNVVLGAVGARGGIVPRSKPTKSHISAERELQSVRAVLIDSSVPWDFVPQTNAEIFRFAAWDGGATEAEWGLPAPGFLEELTDVPTPPAAAIETYAIASGLVKAEPEAMSAAQFLAGIDPTLPTVEKLIHLRCEELFRQRAGTLHRQGAVPVAKVASVEQFEQQLRNGAVWVGEPPDPKAMRCELKEWPANAGAVRTTSAAIWPAPVLPPLASKLYQESDLHEPPERRNA